MPNKLDKFGIKFWLATDVNSKYITNGFPCSRKDKRESSTTFGKFAVFKLIEPFTG